MIWGKIIGVCEPPGRGILLTVEAADGSEACVRVEQSEGATLGDVIEVGGEFVRWAPGKGGAWKPLTRRSEPATSPTS
jgi:hypothetical protein